jgi:hypothetical protein
MMGGKGMYRTDEAGTATNGYAVCTDALYVLLDCLTLAERVLQEQLENTPHAGYMRRHIGIIREEAGRLLAEVDDLKAESITRPT